MDTHGNRRNDGMMTQFDLTTTSTREVNQFLHNLADGSVEILEPRGAHAVACGLKSPLHVDIRGHAGYYCAGMNQLANVTVHGNAGTGVAENMMSGHVRVTGCASQSAGASSCGGLLVIEGDASARCGISLKGGNIVVGGSVGHMSAFMAQAGCLVICGDAGDALGDSIYEARIYLKGRPVGLGVDCVEKSMEARHLEELAGLLEAAGIHQDPSSFRRYGSSRKLYHFHAENTHDY